LKKLKRESGHRLKGLRLRRSWIWWGLIDGRMRLTGFKSEVLMALEMVEMMGSLGTQASGGGAYHGRVDTEMNGMRRELLRVNIDAAVCSKGEAEGPDLCQRDSHLWFECRCPPICSAC